MSAKAILVFCAQALLVQSALSQWIGAGMAPYGLAAPALEFTPTSGGALPVSSVSPNAPVGISLKSDNAYEGILEVVGELPFVGTVGIEGVLPTEGAGAVNHACGNGDNSMVSEDVAFGPAIGPFGAPALGYRAGWAL